MNNLSIRKMNELSKKKKKGFTLVELIIVIAIIAILAAIAIPKFGQITKNANIKADIANAKNLHGVAAQVISEDPSVTSANLTEAVRLKVDGEKLPIPKAVTGQTFSVTYDSNKNIHVTVNSVEVYPATSASYGS